MIRAMLVGLAMVGFASAAIADAAADAAIIGNWVRHDGQVKIRIAPCGDALCAVDTWVKSTDKDEKVGDLLVMTLRPRSPTELAGRAHDERRDMTYSMTITLGPSGMRTHGCVLFGILCKTAEWRRMR